MASSDSRQTSSKMATQQRINRFRKRPDREVLRIVEVARVGVEPVGLGLDVLAAIPADDGRIGAEPESLRRLGEEGVHLGHGIHRPVPIADLDGRVDRVAQDVADAPHHSAALRLLDRASRDLERPRDVVS